MLLAGENPAQSVALVGAAGKLFGLQASSAAGSAACRRRVLLALLACRRVWAAKHAGLHLLPKAARVPHCWRMPKAPLQASTPLHSCPFLHHTQLNDAHVRLGAEDGLAFASVSSSYALELVRWLQRLQPDIHIFFDTFPKKEDPVSHSCLSKNTISEVQERTGAAHAGAPAAVWQPLMCLGTLRGGGLSLP